MLTKIFPLILRNMVRSKTRFLATLGGCAIATFVLGFFFSAGHSIDNLLDSADGEQNIVVRQKGKY